MSLYNKSSNRHLDACEKRPNSNGDWDTRGEINTSYAMLVMNWCCEVMLLNMKNPAPGTSPTTDPCCSAHASCHRSGVYQGLKWLKLQFLKLWLFWLAILVCVLYAWGKFTILRYLFNTPPKTIKLADKFNYSFVNFVKLNVWMQAARKLNTRLENYTIIDEIIKLYIL